MTLLLVLLLLSESLRTVYVSASFSFGLQTKWLAKKESSSNGMHVSTSLYIVVRLGLGFFRLFICLCVRLFVCVSIFVHGPKQMNGLMNSSTSLCKCKLPNIPSLTLFNANGRLKRSLSTHTCTHASQKKITRKNRRTFRRFAGTKWHKMYYGKKPLQSIGLVIRINVRFSYTLSERERERWRMETEILHSLRMPKSVRSKCIFLNISNALLSFWTFLRIV